MNRRTFSKLKFTCPGCCRRPHYAKYFQVTLDSDGQPNLEDVAKVAQNRIMIRVQLTQDPPIFGG